MEKEYNGDYPIHPLNKLRGLLGVPDKIQYLQSILFSRKMEKKQSISKNTEPKKDWFKETTSMTKKEYTKRKKKQLRERTIILFEFSKGKDEDAIAEGFNIPKERVCKEINNYVRYSMSRFTEKTGDEIRRSMAKHVAPLIEGGKKKAKKSVNKKKKKQVSIFDVFM